MVEVLERIAEKNGSVSPFENKDHSEGRAYAGKSVSKDTGYSTFAELYLEPIDVQAGFTASVSTWRGIPTIDDW